MGAYGCPSKYMSAHTIKSQEGDSSRSGVESVEGAKEVTAEAPGEKRARVNSQAPVALSGCPCVKTRVCNHPRIK
jgi:hypothetical protein